MTDTFIGIGMGSILLAVLLLFGSTRHKWANRLLACYLILLTSLFSLCELIPLPSEALSFGLILTLLAWGPCFSLYITLLSKRPKELHARSLLHLLPIALYAYGYVQAPESLPYYFLIQGLGYSIGIIYKLYLHQHKIRNRFSNLNHIKLHWISIFVVIYASISMVYALVDGFDMFSPLASLSMTHLGGICWGYALLLVIQTLRQKDFSFRQASRPSIHKRANAPYVPTSTPKYFPSATLNCFIQFMEEEKPYLNPDLRIEAVEQRLGIPKQTLSELLNHKLRQSFYDFISEYRVEEAKQLILQDPQHHLDEQFIASHTGFESRTQFLNTFRQHTGMSPQAFQQHLALEIA